MTEKNIEHLITAIYGMGMIYIIFYLAPQAYLRNSSTSSQTQNTTIPNAKTIWDKIKIASIALSAIAGLIYAIVKMIQLIQA